MQTEGQTIPNEKIIEFYEHVIPQKPLDMFKNEQ